MIQLINAARALAEVDKEDRAREATGQGSLTPTRPKRATAGKNRKYDD